MQRFSIVFYAKEDGTKPAKEFLLGLDKKMRTRMSRAINLLANNGTNTREPYSKPLDDGIFEIRTQSGTDISRVLYFFTVGKKIVLTNGFIKKTQHTPPGEIERAKKYRADYYRQRRIENERGTL